MSGVDLGGAVAIVTGAGSRDGIGFACARRLAALGARVVVTSTTERAHERAGELGGGACGGDAGDADAGLGANAAFGFVADLTDPAQAVALVAAAIERFGRLDVLVNNAGMTAVTDPEQPAELAGTSDAQWRAALDRNLTTAFNVTRAALPALLDSGRGRVVNVASTSGAVNAYPGDAAYHAAKAGMVGLTRALAVETAARGVTVNAVAPGWIATPSSTERELAMGAATPAGRPGTPDEIAAVVALLAAPAVSYLTGQLIVVDGANSIAEEKHVVAA
ncbi:SDR family NAD(P)-dependent oxidoreductase [Conexibacter stalactiti]|uniref:SDR family NAD(P)-dependent oxidoreductase n=1 Tax=Conexibacter stalactiti TaxID=1940611 RepID=A0ABU4HKK0_9ACTN|nr:SDR family NAD(P)-dependent oxidoreductase [Conexibacter stalactiti]MDW5593234.1 SDR family NAD(P)-dependent oxidoreductase [Conexibacter stalactiti]MEC5033875.1 SDR family NAD(P)-dependent oxidoreductase [Conexibacter stalactiti]